MPTTQVCLGRDAGTPTSTLWRVYEEVQNVVDVHRLPGPVAETWDWQRKGLCRDMDSSLFFHPERERGEARAKRESRAKAVCQRCPVIVQCRQHALATR